LSAPRPFAIAPDEADDTIRARLPVQIAVDPQPGSPFLRVDIWDRFGDHMATPLNEATPSPGRREVLWSGETESGKQVTGGIYIYRITMGDWAESRTLLVEP
jgi:hypothetical protein